MTGQPAPAAVDTPCIGICDIDGASGLCIGCLRNIDEIIAWGGLTPDQRRAIIADLPGRKPTLGPAAQS
ncbi:DUF1289 domain-containing protein [Paracoccus jiaweipingae]|uniref:DUF1289 domain-containing protein n=1 Tax=unclassified Paracoccus (in: a-proteobacteria) TaxID=2688777 RepID=UPI0037A005B5